ncbi:MAG: hypothetical protein HKN73_04320 [Gemmatimonadetes bacterium]|nr:hypothetical protein [Gemmatimonadota bacterium]
MSIPSLTRGRLGLGMALALLLVAAACAPHYGAGVSAGVHVVHHLPRGHVSFVYRGHRHYFDGGRFYRRQGRGYVVVAAPRGAFLPRLPRGGRSYRRGRAEYKEYRGAVFQRDDRGRRKGYRVRSGRDDRRRGRGRL